MTSYSGEAAWVFPLPLWEQVAHWQELLWFSLWKWHDSAIPQQMWSTLWKSPYYLWLHLFDQIRAGYFEFSKHIQFRSVERLLLWLRDVVWWWTWQRELMVGPNDLWVFSNLNDSITLWFVPVFFQEHGAAPNRALPGPEQPEPSSSAVLGQVLVAAGEFCFLQVQELSRSFCIPAHFPVK